MVRREVNPYLNCQSRAGQPQISCFQIAVALHAVEKIQIEGGTHFGAKSRIVLSCATRASRFSFLLAFCALCLAPVAGAREKRPVLPPPPPQPVPLTLKVARGETIELPLAIYGSQKELVTFVLRSKPAHGGVTRVHPTSRETATVSYKPPADLAVKKERLTYAARTAAGFSAPALIEIEIEDAPPKLTVPDVIDFGSILPGKTKEMPLEMTNEGGLPASVHMEATPPWAIKEGADYTLAPGGKKTVTVVFSPIISGPFHSEVRFAGDPPLYTKLEGEAEAPLAVSPAEDILLKAGSGGQNRAASFELVNSTAEEKTVALRAGASFDAPTSVVVPASGRAAVELEAKAGIAGRIDEELVITGEHIDLHIPVRAAATPAFLQAAPDAIHFKPLDQGAEADESVVLKNIGGSPGKWTLTIPPPFTVAAGEISIPAGASATVVIHCGLAPAGRQRAVFLVEGDGQSLEITVEAVVGEQESAPPAVVAHKQPSMRQHTGSMGFAASGSDASEAPSADPQTNFTALIRTDVQIKEIHPTSVVVTWPAPPSGETSFQVDERMLSLGPNKTLQIGWAPHGAVKITKEGDALVAKVSSLAPQSNHTLRFSGKEGPLFTSQFSTPPKTSILASTFFKISVGLLVVFAGIATFWFLRRRGSL